MNKHTKNRARKTRFVGAVAALVLAASAWAAAPELEKVIIIGQPSSKGMQVGEAKAKAKDGEKVVVEGRVKDMVQGHGVFVLIDNSMKSCKDNGENCPTPWDFCCFTRAEITSATATVKVVSEGGKQAIRAELKGVKGFDHLVPVAVEGTAQKDKRGNLVVLANRVYLKK